MVNINLLAWRQLAKTHEKYFYKKIWLMTSSILLMIIVGMHYILESLLFDLEVQVKQLNQHIHKMNVRLNAAQKAPIKKENQAYQDIQSSLHFFDQGIAHYSFCLTDFKQGHHQWYVNGVAYSAYDLMQWLYQNQKNMTLSNVHIQHLENSGIQFTFQAKLK